MRWKGFISLLVVLALIFGGALFFADSILQRSITAGGTRIWGAKVEIDDLTISWSPIGMKIDGVTVASRTEEFKNLFEVDSLNGSVLIKPLLEKKINIEEISGKGLNFNTDRQVSGFLPVEEKVEREKTSEKWKEKLENWLENVRNRAEEKINISEAIEIPDLQSVKVVNETRESLKNLKSEYQEVDLVSGDKHIENLSQDYNNLKKIKIKDESDIVKARNSIERATDNIESAESFILQTQDNINSFRNEITGLEGRIRQIDQARLKDYRAVMDKLELPSIGVEDIAHTVFGEPVVENFQRVINYVELIRKYIPPKSEKEPKKVKRERDRGINVLFEQEKMYPHFLIETASITGPAEQFIKIEDYTTTPDITGKPVQIGVSSDRFQLELQIYRLEENNSEVIELNYNDFEVAGTAGDLSLNGTFTDRQIDTDIKWEGKGVLPENWLNYIKLEDPLINILIGVTGNIGSPEFSISSNIDNLISARLKEELEEKINEVQTEVEKIIDREVDSRKRELEKNIQDFKREQLEKLDREQEKVIARKDEIEEEIEAKRKEIEKLIAEKTDKATEDIKDRAEQELERLFR